MNTLLFKTMFINNTISYKISVHPGAKPPHNKDIIYFRTLTQGITHQTVQKKMC